MMSSTICFAQTEDWIWAWNAGGIFNEARGESLAPDLKDNVFVGGSYSCPSLTFGNVTVTNNGGDDLFLVKYDSAGNALWTASAGDDYADECHGVATDASGSVYITGEFWSPSITIGNTTLVNSGSDDIYVAKYDATGNFLWAKSATGSNEDVCNDVATDHFGNVYIVGSFKSDSISIDGFTVTNTNAGTEDLFIIKFDGNGNVLWASNAAGFDRDQAFGVASDASGNIYVTGNFRSGTISFGAVTIISSGGDDMFIAKFDSAGNALWAVNGLGNGYDYGFSIAIDAKSNAYVTGFFGSSSIVFGSTTLNNVGGENVFLVKYDSSGNALWARQSGQSGFNDYDYGKDVAVGADQSPIIAGWDQASFISFGNDTLTNASATGSDFFFVKYDSSGNVLWAKNSGNSTAGRGYACAADGSGNAYLTGTFGDPLMTLGNFTLSTSGGYDMYLAKYGISFATAINSIESNSTILSLYPNPAEGDFTIRLGDKENGIATVQIIDVIGRVAMREIISFTNGEQSGDKKEIFPDHSLAEGVYLVEVILNDKIYSAQLVYQK